MIASRQPLGYRYTLLKSLLRHSVCSSTIIHCTRVDCLTDCECVYVYVVRLSIRQNKCTAEMVVNIFIDVDSSAYIITFIVLHLFTAE